MFGDGVCRTRPLRASVVDFQGGNVGAAGGTKRKNNADGDVMMLIRTDWLLYTFQGRFTAPLPKQHKAVPLPRQSVTHTHP